MENAINCVTLFYYQDGFIKSVPQQGLFQENKDLEHQ